jgi:hypothetical protein
MSHQRRVWFLLVSRKSHRHSGLSQARTFSISLDVRRLEALSESIHRGSSGDAVALGQSQIKLESDQLRFWCFEAALKQASKVLMDAAVGFRRSSIAYKTSAAASRSSFTASSTRAASYSLTPRAMRPAWPGVNNPDCSRKRRRFRWLSRSSSEFPSRKRQSSVLTKSSTGCAAINSYSRSCLAELARVAVVQFTADNPSKHIDRLPEACKDGNSLWLV